MQLENATTIHAAIARLVGPETTFAATTGNVARCRIWVCAVERRRFPVGVSPTRQMLQPEATGAVMEVTKWLKPSDSVPRIGGSASVQAATQVNAEQTSKRLSCGPTWQSLCFGVE